MLRVKIFSSGTRFNEVGVLEQAIDHWLESEHPMIRQLMQSSAEGQVVLTFLYDDTRRDLGSVRPEAVERDLNNAELDTAADEPDVLPQAELPY